MRYIGGVQNDIFKWAGPSNWLCFEDLLGVNVDVLGRVVYGGFAFKTWIEKKG